MLLGHSHTMAQSCEVVNIELSLTPYINEGWLDARCTHVNKGDPYCKVVVTPDGSYLFKVPISHCPLASFPWPVKVRCKLSEGYIPLKTIEVIEKLRGPQPVLHRLQVCLLGIGSPLCESCGLRCNNRRLFNASPDSIMQIQTIPKAFSIDTKPAGKVITFQIAKSATR